MYRNVCRCCDFSFGDESPSLGGVSLTRMAGIMGGSDGGTRYAIKHGRRASQTGPGAMRRSIRSANCVRFACKTCMGVFKKTTDCDGGPEVPFPSHVSLISIALWSNAWWMELRAVSAAHTFCTGNVLNGCTHHRIAQRRQRSACKPQRDTWHSRARAKGLWPPQPLTRARDAAPFHRKPLSSRLD